MNANISILHLGVGEYAPDTTQTMKNKCGARAWTRDLAVVSGDISVWNFLTVRRAGEQLLIIPRPRCIGNNRLRDLHILLKQKEKRSSLSPNKFLFPHALFSLSQFLRQKSTLPSRLVAEVKPKASDELD
jgi:hypothetical protein